MSGVELTVVSVFGILCAALTACSIARRLAEARVDVARAHCRAHVAVQRMVLEAQLGSPVYVPAEWQEEGL